MVNSEAENQVVPGDFEFDVAISLTAQDEGFARELEEEVSKLVRGEVFLYSRRQEELAISGDLVDRFTKVFREEARVVVILYRPEWGGTPFTSLEQDAIKGRRGQSTNVRWVVVVSMDPPALPEWYPTTEFWLSPQTFSAEAMAGVIAARAGEAGGKIGRESPGEFARRLAEKQRRKAERERRQSMEAGEQTRTEMARLLEELKRHAEEISGAWHPMVVQAENALSFTVSFQRQNLHFFHRPTGNTLRDAELVVQLTRRGDRHVTTWTHRLELDENDLWCWRNTDVDSIPSSPIVVITLRSDDLKTTAELAESYSRQLLQGATG